MKPQSKGKSYHAKVQDHQSCLASNRRTRCATYCCEFGELDRLVDVRCPRDLRRRLAYFFCRDHGLISEGPDDF